MIILFFPVFGDLAVSIMRLDITSGVSSNERSFVLTCNMFKSGLKSHFVDLVKSSISTVFADEKGLTSAINFLLMDPIRR